MNFEDAQNTLIDFMKKSESTIKKQFLSLPNAKKMGITDDPDFESIFVPGTRPDKALLVAHVDTVWHDSPMINIGINNGILFSLSKQRAWSEEKQKPVLRGVGIGADDRAGVAILWALRNLGHSLLLTGCEEAGCQGSRYLMRFRSNIALIQDHVFAMQFDRKDNNDAVFYDVGTKKFVSFIEKQTGFEEAFGTCTDIVYLCRTMPGVNLSVGYQNEHSLFETQDIAAWLRTLTTAEKLLSQELPAFKL